MTIKAKDKLLIGWREWVGLPDLAIKQIKAKIDTGARTSSLHAIELHFYHRKGQEFVKFKVHPEQRNFKKVVSAHARVLEYRKVRSSNGLSEIRPVIVTKVELMGLSWPIELTLTNRDEMGFRMLLGRESFKKRMLVDAGNSFFGKKFEKLQAGNVLRTDRS